MNQNAVEYLTVLPIKFARFQVWGLKMLQLSLSYQPEGFPISNCKKIQVNIQLLTNMKRSTGILTWMRGIVFVWRIKMGQCSQGSKRQAAGSTTMSVELQGQLLSAEYWTPAFGVSRSDCFGVEQGTGDCGVYLDDIDCALLHFICCCGQCEKLIPKMCILVHERIISLKLECDQDNCQKGFNCLRNTRGKGQFTDIMMFNHHS